MARALFVRETIELSDATEQKLLAFARHRGLQPSDTLVVAAYRITAVADYRFDLRDPADPAYLLNVVLLADRFDAPGLRVDVSGDPAKSVGATGASARSAQVFGRVLGQPMTVRADGGAGMAGSSGAAGVDETFTIEEDPLGKPFREYEPPTPGQPGGPGGAGGSGGSASIAWSTGVSPVVSAAGGDGGAGGGGGKGGQGALALNGRRRPGALDGPDGGSGLAGLAGSASSLQLVESDFWAAARADLSDSLIAGAAHWLAVAQYRYRLIKGRPATAEADLVLGLLALGAAADPSSSEAAVLKAQFLAGDNMLGMPRTLDVVPEFERLEGQLVRYGGWVDDLLDDVKDLLVASTGVGLTEAQLAAQLRTLDDTAAMLRVAKTDAELAVAVAKAEEQGSRALWSTALAAVERRKVEMQAPIDWGGVVVVGLFTVVGFVVSLYAGQTAGKLISSIPDLMVLGNVNFSGSEAETQILKNALSQGGGASPDGVGLRSMATDGTIDITKLAAASSAVLMSFASFVKDIDEASGDASLKALVKDLVLRLQERLAATARLGAAQRQAAMAGMRVEANLRERDAYAALHQKARSDASLLQDTAMSLLRIVRQHGDVFLESQFRAARAVEIYTLADQSPAMALDRWHVHPDDELDLDQGFMDTAAYLSRLIASTSDLAILRLADTFDGYDRSGFRDDVHYISVTDPVRLAAFRQQLSTSVTVAPNDLAGTRWQAKVVEAAVTLRGVTASTPSFAVALTHGGRCSEKLRDGSVVMNLLEPRFALVQVATTPSAVAVGAVASDRTRRPREFWRRAVATEWRLSIEPGVLQARSVDLTGLTGIDLALTYEALTPAPTP